MFVSFSPYKLLTRSLIPSNPNFGIQKKLTPKMSKRKRGEFQEERQNQNLYGDGQSWPRGELIGKGSTASVFLATPKRGIVNLLPDDVMAVKSAEISDSALLQKERVILDRLGSSDYVLKCYGEEITTVGDESRMVYNLLFEYGSGGSLADLIKKSGGFGLPENDVRLYTRCMLLGFDYTHRSCGGIVHCDLAPDNNILVLSTETSTGCVAKIGDYGSAKLVKNIERLRLLGPYLRGKIRYLFPEAVLHCIQVPASDIWAIGSIVAEMLTGKSIWEGKTNSEIKEDLCAIGKGQKLISDIIPKGVSKEATDFLKCCFAAKATKRLTANKLLSQPFVAGILDDGEDEEEVLISNDSMRFRAFQDDVQLDTMIMNSKRNIHKGNNATACSLPHVLLAGA